VIEAVAAKRLAAAKILSALSIFTPTTNSRTTVETGSVRWRMRRFISPSVPPTNPIKVRRWRILTSARNSVDKTAKALRTGPPRK
jgi:hypothetical protein